MRVRLFRDSFDTPWGFRLQGGKDLQQPLVVQRVFSNTPAEGELQRGDIILSINSRDAAGLTHKQALDNIKFGGGQVELVIDRPAVSHIKPLNPSSPTRAPSNLPPVPQGPIQIPIRRKSDQSSLKFQSSMPPPVTGHTPTKITLNKYGGGSQSFGSSYGKGPTPAPYSQPYSQQPASMMTRVQDSLDSALSPTAQYQSPPQFQQYQAPPPQQYQSPQYSTGQNYQPMSPNVTPNQQQLQSSQPDYVRSSDPVPEEEYEYIPVSQRKQQFVEKPQKSTQDNHYVGGEEEVEDYPNCPVWERRKMFMKDQPRRAVKRTGKAPRPFKPVSSDYTNYGVDYTKVPTQPAPPKTSFNVAPPPPPPQRPVNAAPDEPDTALGPPAWSNTLRSSNIPKPWEKEQQDYYMTQEQQRGPPPVQPKPAVKPPQAPPQRQITVRSVPNGPPHAEEGPNVVHLQYNSPMGLYSRENIQETYTGQTQGSPHQTSSTVTKTQTQQQPGDRDWNQSYVYRMIHGQSEHRGPTGHAVPQTAPPPPPFKQQQQQQHIPQPAATQMFVNMEEFGTSDF